MVTIDQVLCPVDLSPASASALRHAAAWAHWYHVPLRVLYASVPPQVLADGSGQTVVFPPPPVEKVRAAVEEFISSTLPGDTPLALDVHQGSADSVILEGMARRPGALVVMGTHGATGLKHALLGSVTERVAHATRNPLLVVPPHDAAGPLTGVSLERVLCAVDFRPSSLAALRYALALARRGRMRIELVTVAAWPRTTGERSFEEEYERRVAMRDALRERVPDEARQYCLVHEEVLRGAPADALLTYAGQLSPDLIVMGAGDHGWLHTLWLGSTTARVMRAASCPVLVVPAPRRPAFAATKPVAKDDWSAELDRVSLAYRGQPATMAVLREDLGTQRASFGLPFIGVSADLRRGAGEIAVMLANADGPHLTHVIHHPREVRLHEGANHKDVELVIVGGDGSMTLLDVGGQL